MILPLSSIYSIRALSAMAVEAGKTVEVLIAVETGMGRIGFMPCKESVNENYRHQQLPNIKKKGIFSTSPLPTKRIRASPTGRLGFSTDSTGIWRPQASP